MKSQKSALMLIISMLIFGTIGIFRRFIPLPSSILACIRGALGAVLILILVKAQHKTLDFRFGKKKLLLLFISGALMGFNWILLFEAYNYTTIATATLCYYMQPTIVILVSPLFFKEKLTPKKLSLALVAVVGMVFVSGIIKGSSLSASDIKGIFFGLGAAVLYASVVIINKTLAGIGTYEKTIVQLLSAAVVIVPYFLLTEDLSALSFSASALVFVVIVGIVHTGIAYMLYFGSMDGLPAQAVAIFSYIDPVSALIFSAIFLHEAMSLFEIIGTVLILGATCASELKLKKK